MHIRAMTLDDVPQVVLLEQSVQDFPWTAKQFEEVVNNHHVSMVMQSAGNQVVGFCILQPVLDEANLLLMAIAPSAQNKGLGLQLLEYSLDVLTHQREIREVFLEVRASNVAGQKLYQKAGFCEIAIRKNYYPCCNKTESKAISHYENAVMMAKSYFF